MDKTLKENDLVALAKSQKPLEFEKTFGEQMVGRITALVDAKRGEIATTYLKPKAPKND